MKDDKDKRAEQTRAAVKNPAKDSRQDRLKLALRENLKRRKSQAKERNDIAAAPSDGIDASLHDESTKKPSQ